MNIFEGVEIDFFKSMFGFSIPSWMMWVMFAMIIVIAAVYNVVSAKPRYEKRYNRGNRNRRNRDEYFTVKRYNNLVKKNTPKYSSPVQFKRPQVKFKTNTRRFK